MIFQKLPFRYDKPVVKGANYVKVAILKVLDGAHVRMFPDSGLPLVIQLNFVSDQHTRGEVRKKRQERRVVSLRTPPSERPYPQDWKGPQVFQIPANVTTSPTHASPNLCVSRTMGAFFVCPERPISVQTEGSSSQWDAPETLCDKAQRNSHSGTWKSYFLLMKYF